MALNLSSYGSQVLSSGDLVVRDTASSSHYRVAHATGSDLSSVHSAFVKLDASTQEVTREAHIFDSATQSGRFTSACLGRTPDDMYVTMGVAMETDPERTSFNASGTSSTLSQGLSFNSDESAIYFGGSKTFRIKFEADSPQRLVFQYLEPSSAEYVTKFSCAKV